MGGKLKAAGVLAVMFILGAVSGAAWQTYRSQQRAEVHRAYVTRQIARIQKQLHLAAWQQQALREIIDDAHERALDVHDQAAIDLAQIHDDSLEAIRALLTPEQQVKFDRLHRKAVASHHAAAEENVGQTPAADSPAGEVTHS